MSDKIVTNQTPVNVVKTKNREIACFMIDDSNIDKSTVESFGQEWKAFHEFGNKDLQRLGDSYFDIVTNGMINNENTIAADFGCGSGRWTKYIAPRVKQIAAIDPSDAIFAADEVLVETPNAELFKGSISNLPFNDNYFDFGFSLGVLHHIPDTKQALKDCVKKIKPGGYFLVYLYYNFEDRGFLFKALYKLSDMIRWVVSKFPSGIKKFVCDILAILFYMPFVLLSRLLRFFGVSKKVRSKIPLHGYESTSYYIIRNDALDRFGTPLEQRFSKAEIEIMMKEGGLTDIVFGTAIPYWHAIGRKKA
ncbi:MAG: class I SAM-dependent methyltransferase [Bacteroidota bacterium]|nr:class I SAM-dependent methyltransferase [Bacteroidota bacterium]